MGIQVEFNPDLALRNFEEFRKGNRWKDECIPKDLTEGETYDFLKKGQRNYWLQGEVPLLETASDGLSEPLASIIILECTHFLLEGEVYTKGRYKVTEVFNDSEIHFNGFNKINQKP